MPSALRSPKRLLPGARKSGLGAALASVLVALATSRGLSEAFAAGARASSAVKGAGRWPAMRAETQVAERPATEVKAAEVEEENPRKHGLALMLDEGTRKSHSMAENTQFVTGFFKGLGNRDSFAQLVTSLYFIYQAMEESFQTSADAGVRHLDFQELRRVAAIEEDLAYFYGPSWREQLRPSPAAERYCERIRAVAAENPQLLIAHQYTRYLGDLFGGQMMGGMAESSLGLEDGRGTSFYRFPQIPDTKAFITEWYRELNSLSLSPEEKEAIVEEANLVFRLNIDILEELDGSPLAAAWQLVVGLAKYCAGVRQFGVGVDFGKPPVLLHRLEPAVCLRPAKGPRLEAPKAGPLLERDQEAAIAESTEIDPSYHGHIRDEAKTCWISFPGKYAAGRGGGEVSVREHTGWDFTVPAFMKEGPTYIPEPKLREPPNKAKPCISLRTLNPKP
ncbi:pbsA1 [Symbiodinium sp. KB8]|nr:pbsA1 [Symbiodinium sp. KB8]